MPTDIEVKAMIAENHPRWDEACALSEALCNRILKTTPKTLIGTTMDFVGKVSEVNDKLGGFLSTPKLERTK